MIGLVARALRMLLGSPAARSATRVLVLAASCAALVLGAGALCLVRIPPGTVGVRQRNLWGRGIAEHDHGPGIAFRVPLLESWHLLDARTQALSFGWESEGADLPILDLRTRDGTVVKLGAAIVHRIRPGDAWRIVRDGLKGVWRQRVRAAAEDAIAAGIGELSTIELFDPERLRTCAQGIESDLGARLAADHVDLERVLVTRVWFGPQYEKTLQKRQLAREQELLLAAAIEVEARRARIEIAEVEIENAIRGIAAGLDQGIAERQAAGRSEIAALASGTKTYGETRRIAAQAERDRLVLEGERLVARAEGLKESLMRKALAGPGGRIWLARTAAENLNLRQVTLNSNDPSVPSILDLDGFVKLLIGATINERP